MAVIKKLKSMLGIDDSNSDHERPRDVGVTVEREGGRDGDAAADSQSASAETIVPSSVSDDAEESAAEAPEAEEVEEPEIDEAEAEAPEVEEVDDSEASEADAEEAEEVGEPEIDEAEAEAPEVEEVEEAEEPATDESEAEEADEAEAEAPEEDETESVPVDEIKGIGPAYADRLTDAGVETVADLAGADAADLSEQTDVSEKRVQEWIDRAESH